MVGDGQKAGQPGVRGGRPDFQGGGVQGLPRGPLERRHRGRAGLEVALQGRLDLPGVDGLAVVELRPGVELDGVALLPVRRDGGGDPGHDLVLRGHPVEALPGAIARQPVPVIVGREVEHLERDPDPQAPAPRPRPCPCPCPRRRLRFRRGARPGGAAGPRQRPQQRHPRCPPAPALRAGSVLTVFIVLIVLTPWVSLTEIVREGKSSPGALLGAPGRSWALLGAAPGPPSATFCQAIRSLPARALGHRGRVFGHHVGVVVVRGDVVGVVGVDRWPTSAC